MPTTSHVPPALKRSLSSLRLRPQLFLGIDRGMYEKNNLDVIVKQGNGSGNTVRLVANKDTDFAYASAVTMRPG